MKAVLRVKFIALRFYIYKNNGCGGRSHICNLSTQVKALEQKEEITVKRCRQQEIVNTMGKINKTETK